MHGCFIKSFFSSFLDFFFCSLGTSGSISLQQPWDQFEPPVLVAQPRPAPDDLRVERNHSFVQCVEARRWGEWRKWEWEWEWCSAGFGGCGQTKESTGQQKERQQQTQGGGGGATPAFLWHWGPCLGGLCGFSFHVHASWDVFDGERWQWPGETKVKMNC